MKKMSEIMDLWEEKSRQTGRTDDIIENIPNNGCIIVCHDHSMAYFIIERIKKDRKDVDINTIVFLNLNNFRSYRGQKLPVYIDNCALYLLNKKSFEELEK